MSSSTALAGGPGRPTLLVPALLACYLVWGSTYLAIRLALESLPPLFQMGSRFLTAGVLLMAWSRWRGAAWPTPRQWAHATIVGGLMLGLGMGGVAVAEQHVGSGLVATFVAIVPMLVCLWGLAAGLRAGRLELAGMAVGLLGVALLMRGSSFSAAPGAFACLALATFGWSLGSVLSTTRLPLAAGSAGYASEMLCGGLLLLAASLAAGEQPQWPPRPLAAAAWAYLVGAGSLVAFSAYLYLLANASAAVATSYAFVNPVIALLLGVGLGGESLSGAEWMACAVILAGVGLIFRGKTARGDP